MEAFWYGFTKPGECTRWLISEARREIAIRWARPRHRVFTAFAQGLVLTAILQLAVAVDLLRVR